MAIPRFPLSFGAADPPGPQDRYVEVPSDAQPANQHAVTDGLGGYTLQAIPTAGAGLAAPAFILGTANVAGASLNAPPVNSTIAAFDVTVPVTQALGDAAATGAAAVAARRDHKHGMPALSAATPLVESGAGAVGTGVLSSREDHVHPAAGASVTILRGSVAADGSILLGTGFTITKGGAGVYTINFTVPFGAVPVAVFSGSTDNSTFSGTVFGVTPGAAAYVIQTREAATNGAADRPFTFIAISS